MCHSYIIVIQLLRLDEQIVVEPVEYFNLAAD
nr:MAG TPA: hypothetical protein [Caudoviricetes sp.]